MSRSKPRPSVLVAGIALIVVGLLFVRCTADSGESVVAAGPGSHADLVQLFEEWRAFEMPEFVDGVPDYSAAAMARQHAELPQWRLRLNALAPESWPVAEQIDWHLVRAEMNGLDFDHRVRRPWARDPAFYVIMFLAESDVPAHDGRGDPRLGRYLDLRLSAVGRRRGGAHRPASAPSPRCWNRPAWNLADSNARDLWLAGIRDFAGQASDLDTYAEQVAGTSPDLDQAIADARAASDAFRVWLEEGASSRTGPSGVGADNYTWYMQNVHLVPYSWEEQVTLMRRELARSHSSMRLEENRNRALPELERIASPEEYDRRPERVCGHVHAVPGGRGDRNHLRLHGSRAQGR